MLDLSYYYLKNIRAAEKLESLMWFLLILGTYKTDK